MVKEDSSLRRIADNRKARFEYEILEELECGVELTGTEVKSLRNGQCSLQEAFGLIKNHQLWLIHATIPEYTQGNVHNHVPARDRRLLAHRREIEGWFQKVREKGMTLVPLAIYFKEARIKVLMGLCRGKKMYDKRAATKEREDKREIDRAMKRGR
ncbi:MAG: SsrA-binding protein SmpB [Planctomycetes bacterium]|nr:SsrA-binding protein SmpB [Planctomycetota bacterium]